MCGLDQRFDYNYRPVLCETALGHVFDDLLGFFDITIDEIDNLAVEMHKQSMDSCARSPSGPNHHAWLTAALRRNFSQCISYAEQKVGHVLSDEVIEELQFKGQYLAQPVCSPVEH